MKRTPVILAGVAALAALASIATGANAMRFTGWGEPRSVETIPGMSATVNTAALEGCAFISQRDDILYFASNRSGGMGGLDIWYATRETDGTWSGPVNFSQVNSAADEFCPTATRNGRDFLFVSTRAGGCGGADLYAARRHQTRGWAAPHNLGCVVNSAGDEAGPYLLGDDLYFSSSRAGGFSPEAPGAVTGDGDIYSSAFDGASFGAPVLVPALNTSANDLRPNLRRDGLEIFFDSNREGGIGGIDLWVAHRASTADAWSAPENLGSVNSSANDLRASLSWDGSELYFGSTRGGGEGSQDIYVATREKVTGD